MNLTIEQLTMTDDEFYDHLRHEAWCIKNKGSHGRRLSEAEAIDIFKDDLYQVCMDKIGSDQETDTFKSLLIKLRNHRKGDLNVDRARQVDLTHLLQSFGFDIRYNKMCCPIHEDKTPSFVVFKNNRFKCFGCGVWGDPIEFIKLYKQCDFVTAVKFLMMF